MVWTPYASLLTARLNLEIFLEALFLWYTPLVAALLISEVAAVRAVCAAALSFAAMAASTFLMDVFTLERIDLFLAALFSETRILFFADLMLANVNTSICDIHKMYLVFITGGHGHNNEHTKL